jgi:hypothetical protein
MIPQASASLFSKGKSYMLSLVSHLVVLNIFVLHFSSLPVSRKTPMTFLGSFLAEQDLGEITTIPYAPPKAQNKFLLPESKETSPFSPARPFLQKTTGKDPRLTRKIDTKAIMPYHHDQNSTKEEKTNNLGVDVKVPPYTPLKLYPPQ